MGRRPPAWLPLALCLPAACAAPDGPPAGAPAGGEAAAGREPARAAEPVPVTEEEALAVFDAAWERIAETHFDLDEAAWEAARDELRPRAAAADERDELRRVVRELLGRLDQSHFALIPREAAAHVQGDAEPSGEDGGDLGLDVRIRDGSALVVDVLPGSAAEAAGIRPGWVVERAGDVDVAEALAELDPDEVPGRWVLFELREAVLHATRGPVGSEAELVLRDGDDRRVSLAVPRLERDAVAHGFGNLPTFHLRFEDEVLERDGVRVGRLHFTNWFLPMVRPLDEAVDRMRALDGIVVDLRGNSGGAGAMVMGFAGHFFDDTELLGTQTMRDGELRYVALPRRVNARGKRVEPYDGPLAILVDETSASASEVFAGGVGSTGRARVFGETTAGAVLPAVVAELPNGDALLHALGDFRTAEGVLLEGRGVVPDEVVPLSRADLLAGRDPQLEAALRWIAARARGDADPESDDDPAPAGSDAAGAVRGESRSDTPPDHRPTDHASHDAERPR